MLLLDQALDGVRRQARGPAGSATPAAALEQPFAFAGTFARRGPIAGEDRRQRGELVAIRLTTSTAAPTAVVVAVHMSAQSLVVFEIQILSRGT